MRTSLLQHLTFGGMLIAVLYAVPAHAATRTWVSGTGDDMNPCSFTAPCKTFASAITKTDPGGEISVQGPGGYGQVTITKAITINGEGSLASILAPSGVAITVSAAATDKVVLRNLSLTGAGGGAMGVQILSGNVTIDKCLISQFTSGFVGGFGIYMNASATSFVAVIDTNLVNNSHGVWLQTSSGSAVGSLDNVRITGSPGYGVIAGSGADISMSRSVVYNAGTGALLTNASGAMINATDSTLTNTNGIAVSAAASGSIINLNNMTLFNNLTALSTAAGATIATGNNNKAAGYGGALTTNGTINGF
jgi:hypothetical protein